ncbi:MAG: DUF748 domain-containing protein, partial [Proteobacteria bacterium]|nr:DUF748 domain-containing protein [Pseudomonadota bacterium]
DKSGKNLATIPELQISGNFIPLAKTYHITNLVLNNPKILLERDPGGKLNIPVQSSGKEASTASQIKLRIDNILVKNGDLSFIDQSVKGGFAASWKDCGFTFESPASDPAKPASFAVNLRDRDNFGISAQGTFLQSPLTANGLLVIDQFNLERIRPYLDLGDELRLSSGSASKIETNFTYLQHEKQKAPSLLLHGLKTDIKDLAITVDSKDFLHLPFTSIIGGTIAFADKTMHLSSVRTTNGQLILEWPSGPPKPEITSPGKSPLWTFSMDTFSFAKGALDIISPDQNKSSRIRLQNLSLDASGLNNSQNQPGAISGSGQFATKGSIKFSGGITTNPFSASLDSQLLNVDLSPLQPFLFSWFRPAISQGMLTAEGLITLPDFSFQGTAELADFAAKSKDNPLCEWRMAHGADLFFAAKPMRFTAQNLTFAEPVISWSVKKENLSTFTAVFAHPQSPENLRPIVAINTITVNSGLLKFSDATVLPVYSTSIENITGTLTNLHNRKPDHTGIELKGSMNHNTEIAVSGWLSILEEINSASIHATATALDLPPLSLYLNNLMGGKIDKGKADYAIYLTKEANKLSATNTFRIYDLETSRPIKENASLPLAIALLTEPNNDILLDLTFEDDLADQNFAFRGRITKLFRNILLKTAVNPYSLLATLSSAEIDHILFAFGADTIDEKEKIKLFEIAKILKQRPLLSLDIRGFADNTGDRNAILNTMKEAQKRKLQIRENRLSTELSNSYGREEIGKPLLPQNQTGVEDSPKNSKEPSISNEILTNLAQRRQLAVHDYLVNVGVATNRLSTRVPVSLVPAGAPGRAGNRVDFILVPATFSK